MGLWVAMTTSWHRTARPLALTASGSSQNSSAALCSKIRPPCATTSWARPARYLRGCIRAWSAIRIPATVGKRDGLHKRRVEAKIRRQVGLFVAIRPRGVVSDRRAARGDTRRPTRNRSRSDACAPCRRSGRSRPARVPDRLGMVAAEAPHEGGEPHVGHHREVRGGVARIDLCAAAAIEHSHGLACRGQQVGGRQAGDAAADHDDIDLKVVVERGEAWHRGALGPVRRSVHVRVGVGRHANGGSNMCALRERRTRRAGDVWPNSRADITRRSPL